LLPRRRVFEEECSSLEEEEEEELGEEERVPFLREGPIEAESAIEVVVLAIAFVGRRVDMVNRIRGV
jgi:hypothetical protein